MRAYDALKEYMDRAMAIRTAMTLFEWDNETLAPRQAGALTAEVIGSLSGEYFSIITGREFAACLAACQEEDGELTEAESANVRELAEELERIKCIPREEYQAFARLTAQAGAVWAQAKRDRNFMAFAPALASIIQYQKKFAAYRAKEGEALYDVMLDEYEKGK